MSEIPEAAGSLWGLSLATQLLPAEGHKISGTMIYGNYVVTVYRMILVYAVVVFIFLVWAYLYSKSAGHRMATTTSRMATTPCCSAIYQNESMQDNRPKRMIMSPPLKPLRPSSQVGR